ALASVISTATGVEPYYIGKPNPLMMKSVLRYMGAYSSESAMVGDRMDTDIIAGMEAGMTTVLVLTGVTDRDMADKFPYSPTYILNSAAEIEK
ncbi:MAG: HAD hydrolase-like protein, partial [Armatimonadetes bacterium]|nr:HAD hydrolase-like protein [Candidatus Hippobium faecium]